MTYDEMKAEMTDILRGFSCVPPLPDNVTRLRSTNPDEYEHLVDKACKERMLGKSERLKRLYSENDVPDDIKEMLVASHCGHIFARTFGRGILE
jgi:hypothetical protein